MEIPNCVVDKIKKSANPLDNNYFNHAIPAINSLKNINSKNYCYDYFSMTINTLERLYKGFLDAANTHAEWYTLPSPHFLKDDHDLLKLVLEIKNNFSEVFPQTSKEEWRDIKNFLRDLRSEYTNSRYTTYPDYTDFKKLYNYVENQYNLLKDAIEIEHVFDSDCIELKEDF